jgi:hypothetical protein
MEKKLPMVVTKLELIKKYSNYYRVTYEYNFRFINNYTQIEETADNFDEIKPIMLPIERKRKIYKLLNKEFKIYTNKIIFLKKNY